MLNNSIDELWLEQFQLHCALRRLIRLRQQARSVSTLLLTTTKAIKQGALKFFTILPYPHQLAAYHECRRIAAASLLVTQKREQANMSDNNNSRIVYYYCNCLRDILSRIVVIVEALLEHLQPTSLVWSHRSKSLMGWLLLMQCPAEESCFSSSRTLTDSIPLYKTLLGI
jgi:hypothetical protein